MQTGMSKAARRQGYMAEWRMLQKNQLDELIVPRACQEHVWGRGVVAPEVT